MVSGFNVYLLVGRNHILSMLQITKKRAYLRQIYLRIFMDYDLDQSSEEIGQIFA